MTQEKKPFYSANFSMWLNLALSSLRPPFSGFFMVFFVFLFLLNPYKIAPLPNVSQANALQPKLIASMDVPTPTIKRANATLNKQKVIIIKQESDKVKVEIFDNLENAIAASNLKNGTLASRMALKRSVDVYNRFIRQSLFNNFFLNSKVATYHTDMFELLSSFEERVQYQHGTHSKMHFMLEQYLERQDLERQDIEKQLGHKIRRLSLNTLSVLNNAKSSVNINNSTFRLQKYISYRKSPLERQIGVNRFSEKGTTRRTNIYTSKIILDLINGSISEKYSGLKETIEMVTNSMTFGRFNSNSISQNNFSSASNFKHWRCFVHQKYYMVQNLKRARDLERRGLAHLCHEFPYPAKVMNEFGLDSSLPFRAFREHYPTKYRVTNNSIWHDTNKAKSTDSGQFYEFHLLDYGAAVFLNKEAIWTNYLTRYGDLTVHGTMSSTMNQHFGEIDVNFARMGFDVLRKVTEKASSKSTTIANLKPIVNLLINTAEDIFKYKLKLCMAQYRSFRVPNPDQGLNDLYPVGNRHHSRRRTRLFLPWVPSFNFDIGMENAKALRIDNYLNMCNSSGIEEIPNHGVVLYPEVAPDVKPLYSKTFADWYIYKGVEVSYISIVCNLLRFTNENLNSIVSIMDKLKIKNK